jgi:hypothetical protein
LRKESSQLSQHAGFDSVAQDTCTAEPLLPSEKSGCLDRVAVDGFTAAFSFGGNEVSIVLKIPGRRDLFVG